MVFIDDADYLDESILLRLHELSMSNITLVLSARSKLPSIFLTSANFQKNKFVLLTTNATPIVNELKTRINEIDLHSLVNLDVGEGMLVDPILSTCRKISWNSQDVPRAGFLSFANKRHHLPNDIPKAMPQEALDLQEFMNNDDRALIVLALQALHRERKNAYNVALTVALARGEHSPSCELFGLTEVSDILTRVGATGSSN